MKAIVHTQPQPITADNALIAVDIDKPVPGPRDLLVRVRAISVNPVDVKVRENLAPEGPHRVLGYDAAGYVEAVGSEVTLFNAGMKYSTQATSHGPAVTQNFNWLTNVLPDASHLH